MIVVKRTKAIETLRAKLELAEIQRDLHSAAECEFCRKSVTDVTAPVCFIALEQNTRIREYSQQLAANRRH